MPWLAVVGGIYAIGTAAKLVKYYRENQGAYQKAHPESRWKYSSAFTWPIPSGWGFSR